LDGSKSVEQKVCPHKPSTSISKATGGAEDAEDKAEGARGITAQVALIT
jgi:hypothetical protein